MKCNLCESEENELIWDKTRFEENNILKCKKCNLVFLEIKKTKKEMEDFYRDDYRKVDELPEQTPEELFNDPVTRNDCKERIEFIKKRYGDIKGKKILEIGSSSGYFLEVMKNEGANVSGIELTKSYSDFSKNLGFKVYTEPIEDLGIKDEFDLVVTFHTMEHVYCPMSVIKSINSSLKEDGKFLGEVPNQDDWRISKFNNETIKRFHYDPNHYYYYSPKTLRKYLEKCNFTDINLETVERYNSLVQFNRILGGEYNKENYEEVLKKDIFAKEDDDLRLPTNDSVQMEFNRMFGKEVNKYLMGNCLRWTCTKDKSS